MTHLLQPTAVHAETDSEIWTQISRVHTQCPICQRKVFGAAGRGFCPECFVTFPIRGPTRKAVVREFVLRYYQSRHGQHYHRAGCKYLRNIAPENLIEVTEPTGRPCQCIR